MILTVFIYSLFFIYFKLLNNLCLSIMTVQEAKHQFKKISSSLYNVMNTLLLQMNKFQFIFYFKSDVNLTKML